jgi:hypothetical protein
MRRKSSFEDYKKEYEKFDPIGTGKLAQSKFSRWLKVLGKVKYYEVVEWKTSSKKSKRFVMNLLKLDGIISSVQINMKSQNKFTI